MSLLLTSTCVRLRMRAMVCNDSAPTIFDHLRHVITRCHVGWRRWPAACGFAAHIGQSSCRTSRITHVAGDDQLAHGSIQRGVDQTSVTFVLVRTSGSLRILELELAHQRAWSDTVISVCVYSYNDVYTCLLVVLALCLLAFTPRSTHRHTVRVPASPRHCTSLDAWMWWEKTLPGTRAALRSG